MGFILSDAKQHDFIVAGFLVPKLPDMSVSVYCDGIPKLERVQPQYDDAAEMAYIVVPKEVYEPHALICAVLKASGISELRCYFINNTPSEPTIHYDRLTISRGTRRVRC